MLVQCSAAVLECKGHLQHSLEGLIEEEKVGSIEGDMWSILQASLVADTLNSLELSKSLQSDMYEPLCIVGGSTLDSVNGCLSRTKAVLSNSNATDMEKEASSKTIASEWQSCRAVKSSMLLDSFSNLSKTMAEQHAQSAGLSPPPPL